MVNAEEWSLEIDELISALSFGWFSLAFHHSAFFVLNSKKNFSFS